VLKCGESLIRDVKQGKGNPLAGGNPIADLVDDDGMIRRIGWEEFAICSRQCFEQDCVFDLFTMLLFKSHASAFPMPVC
jgi:hypothetical protein